jgi:hypothetical protein
MTQHQPDDAKDPGPTGTPEPPQVPPVAEGTGPDEADLHGEAADAVGTGAADPEDEGRFDAG